MTRNIAFCLRFALAAALTPAAAFAQGSLAPPSGPVGPTMKTLAEIDAAVADSRAALLAKAESRVPISDATTPGNATADYIISAPGSYYLTGNIQGSAGKSGIRIAASHVTLDLEGFVLTGSPGSVHGIVVASGSHIRIQRGHLTGWNRGVSSDTTHTNLHLAELHVQSTSGGGLNIPGAGAIIERCHIADTTGAGILASFDGSLVRDCTVTGVSHGGSDNEVYGIAAAVIEGCVVSGIVSLGGAFGIVGARNVARTHVKSIRGATGTVLISAQVIETCSVSNDSLAVTGSISGLSGTIVRGSYVRGIATESSSNANGVQAARVVDCVVEVVSNIGTGVGVGIAVTQVGLVTGCSVSGVSGVSGGYGIRNLAGHALLENNRVASCETGISANHGLVRNNFTNNNTTGLEITNSGVATGNTSRADTTAFSFAAGVRHGPVVAGGGAGGFDATANIDL